MDSHPLHSNLDGQLNRLQEKRLSVQTK